MIKHQDAPPARERNGRGDRVLLAYEKLRELIVLGRLAPGATVVSLGARDPEPYADRLRRLSRTGYAVTHLSFGPDRDAHRASMADAGIAAHVASLDPDWRDADALVLAR